MAQRSRFWDGTTIGDATVAPYDAGTEFSEVMTAVAGLTSDPNKGGVVSTISVSMFTATTLRIGAFEALVYGAWYQNDANIDITVPTPAAATRIDTVVLRKNWAAQTVRVFVINGTEGGSAPALVQTPGVTWDVPIATLSTTTGGVTTITPNSARADFWYRTAPGIIKTDNSAIIQTPFQVNPLTTRSVGVTDAEMVTFDSNEILKYSAAYFEDISWTAANPSRGTMIAFGTDQIYTGLPNGGRFALAAIKSVNLNPGGNPIGALQFWANDSANNRQRKTAVLDSGGQFTLTTKSSRGFVVGDVTGGGQPAQQRYIAVNDYAKGGSGSFSADTCIEFCAPNPNSMGIDFHVPNVAKWGGLYMIGAGNVYLGADIGWGAPALYMGGTSFNFGFGRLRAPGGSTPIIDGQAGGFLLLGGGHSGGNAISVAPHQHNAIHLGWGDRGWALVHSVGGVVLDSLEEHKQNFVPLNPAECAEAVLNTDWLAFEYKPPEDQEMPARLKEMDDDAWERFQADYVRMQEEAALSRRQRGYALGSDRFRVHPLFGMANRKTAGPQSDLATVACALQAALKRIDEQQAQLDALREKVN